jgi:SAM-dependent methyltransferase
LQKRKRDNMTPLLQKILSRLAREWTEVPLRRRFKQSFETFAGLARGDRRFKFRWEDRYPCLYDSTPSNAYDRHYVLHTAWAARVLAQSRPIVHIDFSSSLYFVAIASAFVPIRFYDFRPATLPLSGLESGAADLLRLPFGDGELPSVSCMHVIEHVGLGRYGDPLDPTGDLTAAAELSRVLAPGGQLLFVVPVGRARVMFNAHRIYSYELVRDMFAGLHLHEFSLIPDTASEPELIANAPPEMVAQQAYACGCFWFRKQ